MAKAEDPKQKALNTAVSQIEKQYGKGSIMRLGDDDCLDIDGISTTSLTWRSVGGGSPAAGSSRSSDPSPPERRPSSPT